MAEKVTISRISHFDKDKNGNPFTSKTGKPYTRCLIDLTDGRKVSGFGNQTTRTFKEGDEVELELTQSNGYWNFNLPKVERGGLSDQDKERFSRIEQYAAANNVMLKKLMAHFELVDRPKIGNTNIDYPDGPVDNFTAAEEDTRKAPPLTDEQINPEDIPFN